jgi:outer membrane receptor protein involved in Fe transport
LACADENKPCSGIPNAFGADPELKAVISRTAEFGLRGHFNNNSWRLAVFRTELSNDIIFNSTTITQGYFSNVGRTRRQGFELGLNGNNYPWDYALNMNWMDATFQSPFHIANEANSSCTSDCPLNKKGDKIPGIPETMVKLHLGYSLASQTRLGATLQMQGSVYARGDENNLDANGKVPSYTTLKIDGSHRLNKSLELFAGVTNVFDKRYATYGVVAHNNLSGGTAEQFRSLGAPRAVFAGVRGNF